MQNLISLFLSALLTVGGASNELVLHRLCYFATHHWQGDRLISHAMHVHDEEEALSKK